MGDSVHDKPIVGFFFRVIGRDGGSSMQHTVEYHAEGYREW
jgi:hypothetical protein